MAIVSPFGLSVLLLKEQETIKLGFFIGALFFELSGYFLLRMALWNTYGKEIISFEQNKLEYQTDYGWFIDSVEIMSYEKLHFSFIPMGYVEDKRGVLKIDCEENEIISSIQISMEEGEELVFVLENKFKHLLS